MPSEKSLMLSITIKIVGMSKSPGRLGTASLTWQMPGVPNNDRSLPYIIKLHAKRTQGGVAQEFKVTGTVGRFDVSPVFEDATFLVGNSSS